MKVQWELTAFLCTALICMTVLLVTHVIAWPWVLSSGIALFFWVSQSPFASPLEKAAILIIQRELAQLTETTTVTATVTKPTEEKKA